jgi:peptide-methionine (R)-S-oxide reductase
MMMKVDMTKRTFLGSAAAALGILGFAGCSRPSEANAAERFEVTKTPAEWKRQLGPARYAVLREEDTERAGSSQLDKEKRNGTYVCAGCALPLYSSAAKFESGTGWPSFFKPLPNAVRTKADRGIFGTRTEVHCRRCGGHLGHVFDDGPPPTGKRYCMNGLAMRFVVA